MELDLKKLMESLIVLDKEARKLDEALKDLRQEIHSLLWDLVDLKNTKTESK